MPEPPEGQKIRVWDEIRPYFEELARLPLDSASYPDWIGRWDRLGRRVTETYNRLYVESAADCCEAVAMATELLVLPHLGELYGPEDSARVRLRSLLDIPVDLCYIALVDAFEHWAHAHPSSGHDGRDSAAADFAARFFPGFGWEAQPDFQTTFWQRKEHIFMLPFYYINYAFAQFGALQVWECAQRDPERASSDLATAMAMGGTAGREGFYRAAGVELRWDRPFLAGLMDSLERAINVELRNLGRGPLDEVAA